MFSKVIVLFNVVLFILGKTVQPFNNICIARQCQQRLAKFIFAMNTNVLPYLNLKFNSS
jgi:hypothetical protein